jgi:hypothetical protein
MKTIFLFLVTIVAVASFGCEEVITENERKENIELGWLVDYNNFVDFPDTIQLNSEVNTSLRVYWKDWCVKRTYFEVEKENTFTYRFTTKDVIGVQGCLDEIRDTITSFKFKPEQKGSYTLKFIDRIGTKTKTLVVE